MDDLRKLRLWIWNLDVVWQSAMPNIGLHVVPLPVDAAGRAYEDGQLDGLLALPSAALVYQWSARSRYFTDLPIAAMAGCNFVSTSVFDALPIASQKALRDAAAKLNYRITEANGALEDALIGGLFEKQGVKRAAGDRAAPRRLLRRRQGRARQAAARRRAAGARHRGHGLAQRLSGGAPLKRTRPKREARWKLPWPRSGDQASASRCPSRKL